MRIILLDLNATLVENSSVHSLPHYYNVSVETYRKWLVDMLREEYVILLTVRPIRYQEETLLRIMQLEKWQPNESYFSAGFLKAPDAKEQMLKEKIFPRFGRNKELGHEYFAIESNASTRQMYRKHGIDALTQRELFLKNTAF